MHIGFKEVFVGLFSITFQDLWRFALQINGDDESRH